MELKFIFLEKFTESLVDEIKKELIKQDKKSSGDLIKSIDFKVDKRSNSIFISLLAEDYFLYVDQGRKPGKFPDISKIKKWIIQKRIRPNKGTSLDQLTFLIARSIKENGIEPTNILNKSIENIYRKNKFNKVLFDTFQQEIDDMLKNLGF